MCSAYLNADNRYAIVIINYGGTDKTVAIEGLEPSMWNIYRTTDNANESLALAGSQSDLKKIGIQARSITTIVSNGS